MKLNKLIIFSVLLMTVITTSCNSNDNGLNDLTAQWKIENETYFTNMKDSVGYVLYNIPTNRGGSSFYYKITSTGDQNSASPLITDNVTVNYRGKEIDGFIFDQTYKGNGPLIDSTAVPRSFYVNKLIPGWTENLIQMKAGEKRTIVIPQELGYGSNGIGFIPAYSTLIFEMHLISINKSN